MGLFGDDAERLLLNIRGRASADDDELASVDKARAERIRELVRIVQESGIGEVTIEEDGMRVSVRSTADATADGAAASEAPLAIPEPGAAPVTRPSNGFVRIESPMVGTFYRSASPTAEPFVEEGDRVEIGQTLCVLEAMKLFNELKSEHSGVIRAVLVNNAEPVEYGQALFELEPV